MTHMEHLFQKAGDIGWNKRNQESNADDKYILDVWMFSKYRLKNIFGNLALDLFH